MRCVPVYDHASEAIKFVEEGLWGGKRQFGEATAIGFANEKEGFVSAFVFHDYEPEKGIIEISAYSKHRKWCTSENLKALFSYPFEQLNARLVIARHSENNARARRIWHALGAIEYIIPELWDEGEAMVLAVYKKTAWAESKFMRNKNGQA